MIASARSVAEVRTIIKHRDGWKSLRRRKAAPGGVAKISGGPTEK
jgi:hypothetical protein